MTVIYIITRHHHHPHHPHQVRRGTQRRHPVHLSAQPPSLGRCCGPMRHPRVQCQSQRLREYRHRHHCQRVYLQNRNHHLLPNRSTWAHIKANRHQLCPTWHPLGQLLTFPSILIKTHNLATSFDILFYLDWTQIISSRRNHNSCSHRSTPYWQLYPPKLVAFSVP